MKKKPLAAEIAILFTLIFSNLLPLRGATAEEIDTSVTQEAATTLKILITVVDFKNKEHDSVTIRLDSVNVEPVNLKGYQFEDDSSFKTISDDYFINPNEDYVLTFKSDTSDNAAAHTLATARSGLTATT